MRKFVTILLLIVTSFTFAGEQEVRECLELWNLKNIGIREATGNNDGGFINHIQKMCKSPLGSSYCACYVNAGFIDCGVPKEHLPWCPAWTPCWEQTEYTVFIRGVRGDWEDVQQMDMFLLYYQHLARVGHIGFIAEINLEKGYIITYEGNTADPENEWNPGEGVHGKKRKLSQIYKVVNYVAYLSGVPVSDICVVKKHKVSKKETLYRIAINYDTTVTCLIEWNNIENNIIHLGQELIVSECPNEC